MERKIYLIFADRVDTVCEVKGYIRGTEAEAQAYCVELNKSAGDRQEEFVWMELPQLSIYDLWKETMSDGFTTVPKTAEKWGVTRAHVYNLCKQGRVPGAVYDKDHWCIPVDAEMPTNKFVAPIRKAAEWNVSYDLVTRLCAMGEIPGAELVNKKWRIPVDAENPLDGYVLVFEMAERWGMHRVLVSKACTEGRIPGAKQVGRNWYIPVNAEKPANKMTDRRPGYLSATELAEKWGTNRQAVCRYCREGRIPGAEYIDDKWHIPEDAKRPEDRRGKRR